jgi:hypothetical protein
VIVLVRGGATVALGGSQLSSTACEAVPTVGRPAERVCCRGGAGGCQRGGQGHADRSSVGGGRGNGDEDRRHWVTAAGGVEGARPATTSDPTADCAAAAAGRRSGWEGAPAAGAGGEGERGAAGQARPSLGERGRWRSTRGEGVGEGKERRRSD